MEERLEGDLVLQNGEGIFTLQLGFPFRTKLKPQAFLRLRRPSLPKLQRTIFSKTFFLRLCISAAGWTRATVGGKIPSSVESRHKKIAMGSKLVILIFCRKLPRLRRERNSLVQLCRSGNSASQGLGSSKPSFQPFGVGWLVGW